ncbi:MAG TPA: methyltransferase domain-containing protein [Fimbriimonas sp.]|nr:methyltransferase domain-containing protein [Fimbriimonas sp.]
MTDQLLLGSWPLDLNPVDHPYLLPAPYQEVAVTDGRWNAELYSLRRRPILSSLPIGRTWKVSPILPELIRNREPGTAIDLGCGNGREAVWLAANGWGVTAVDRLSECEARVNQLAEFHGVADRIEVEIANLATFCPGTKYNLVLAHYTYLEGIQEIAQSLCEVNGAVSILSHSRHHFECFGTPTSSAAEGHEFWSRDRHSSWKLSS